MECGPPPDLEHGQYHGEDFYAGSTVLYQCKPGFYLLGESKMLCTNNGKWIGNPPACLGKILSKSGKEPERSFQLTISLYQSYQASLYTGAPET